MADLMRDQFEEFWLSSKYSMGTGKSSLVREWKDDPESPYAFNRTECMWEMWKASRESMVVMLPERWYDGHGMPRVEPNGNLMDSTEVIDAIHAAGIKTK